MDSKHFYLAMACLRLTLACVPIGGYIHPDEYFQSAEPMAMDVFGVQAVRTWDWNGTVPDIGPIRNVLSPFLLAWAPFRALQYLGGGLPGSALPMLIAPRLACTLLSFICDWAVVVLAPAFNADPMMTLTLWATSYTVFTYLQRPFSNHMEAVAYAVLMVLCVRARLSGHAAWVMGLLTGIGICVRPTFAVFALGPCVHWATRAVIHGRSSLIWVFGWLLAGVMGLLMGVGLGVAADSMYYGTLHMGRLWNGLHGNSVGEGLSWANITLTSLNNLRYNLDPARLAEHGIHWRGTHMFVSLPLLYGPLAALLFLHALHNTIVNVWRPTASHNNTRNVIGREASRSESQPAARKSRVPPALMMHIVIPVLIFSGNPHQEPRFLLPLGVLMAILGGGLRGGMRSRLLWVAWVAFNAGMFAMFGVIHQGGLVPSLLHLQSAIQAVDSSWKQTNAGQGGVAKQTPCLLHIVYHSTYMPPRHLLLLPTNGSVACIHDLKGAPMGERDELLDSIHRGEPEAHVYYISPATVAFNRDGCMVVHRFWPHFSGEDPPSYPFYDQLYLNMYQCTANMLESEKIRFGPI